MAALYRHPGTWPTEMLFILSSAYLPRASWYQNPAFGRGDKCIPSNMGLLWTRPEVVHSNSVHIPVDKFSHKANPDFIGSWEMYARMCPGRRGNGFTEELTAFTHYLT